jgi:hypothetical protein
MNDAMFTDKGMPVPVTVKQEAFPMGVDNQGNPIYCPFLSEGGVRYIAAVIKERLADKYDAILMITGQPRRGKSTLAMQIALEVDRQFKLDKVAFRANEFTEILNKNPYADLTQGVIPQGILDESGFDLFSQDWMMREQKELVKTLAVIGLKNQVLYFVLPHRDDLNRSIRETRIAIWIDTDIRLDIPIFERGYAELRVGMPNKFKREQWWQPRCAFYFGELTGQLWDDYIVRKKAFIDRAVSEETQPSSSTIERLTAARNNLMRAYYEYRQRKRDGISQDDLGKLAMLERSRVSKILSAEVKQL